MFFAEDLMSFASKISDSPRRRFHHQGRFFMPALDSGKKLAESASSSFVLIKFR